VTGGGTGSTHQDPLHNLREYRTLAPWNLRDLASLVGAILDASAITPINAAAKAQPSERTIRFYVTKGLVSPPEGRGTAATYSYRHFLQLLWIKLRQMEGATLATITKEMQDQTGDVRRRSAHRCPCPTACRSAPRAWRRAANPVGRSPPGSRATPSGSRTCRARGAESPWAAGSSCTWRRPTRSPD